MEEYLMKSLFKVLVLTVIIMLPLQLAASPQLESAQAYLRELQEQGAVLKPTFNAQQIALLDQKIARAQERVKLAQAGPSLFERVTAGVGSVMLDAWSVLGWKGTAALIVGGWVVHSVSSDEKCLDDLLKGEFDKVGVALTGKALAVGNSALNLTKKVISFFRSKKEPEIKITPKDLYAAAVQAKSYLDKLGHAQAAR
jgi:hypothetical protein